MLPTAMSDWGHLSLAEVEEQERLARANLNDRKRGPVCKLSDAERDRLSFLTVRRHAPMYRVPADEPPDSVA